MHKLPIFARVKEAMDAGDKFLFEVRLYAAQNAGWNVFAFPAKMVDVDLASDSGTGPLSAQQLALLQEGNARKNRAYANRESFRVLEDTVAEILGLGAGGKGFHFFPFPQGRAAEAVFFGCVKDALTTENMLDGMRVVVPSNSHFDTTRANIELVEFEAHDLLLPVGEFEPGEWMFRGNMDTLRLEELLRKYRQTGFDDYDESPHAVEVPVVLMTITNNTRGGLPVSMANLRTTRELCDEFEVPFFFDAARFAENAYFIKKYEAGYEEKTIPEIVREMFSYCDGFLISFKKDGLSHTGGGLVLKKQSALLAHYPDLSDAIATRLIITMSNDTQGGIPGGYQLAIAEGLRTATTEEYLEERVSQIARFGQMFLDAGIPVLEPFGGHAVYLDVDRFFADTKMRREDFGGIALTALLLLYSVRACELGAFAFGKYDANAKSEVFPDFNFVRFAVPRRGYKDSELAQAVRAVKALYEMRHEIPRAVPIYGRDVPLRHFKARFALEPISC